MTCRIFTLQSTGELLAAVVQKYFSMASAHGVVALLGNLLNLGSFGVAWKYIAGDGEELVFGFVVALAPSPKFCSKVISPFKLSLDSL